MRCAIIGLGANTPGKGGAHSISYLLPARGRLFVNHQRRYGKPFEAFREAATRIGDLLSLEAVQPFSHIMDFGSHVIDIALFVLGPARQLKSLFAAVDWNNGRDWQGTRVESHALATIWFNDGVRLTFESGLKPIAVSKS